MNASAAINISSNRMADGLCGEEHDCSRMLLYETSVSTQDRRPWCYAVRPVGDARLNRQALNDASSHCGLACTRLPGPTTAFPAPVQEACYASEYTTANRTCFECPRGAVCCGASLQHVAPLPQYWPVRWNDAEAMNDGTPMFARCANPWSCKGIDGHESDETREVAALEPAATLACAINLMRTTVDIKEVAPNADSATDGRQLQTTSNSSAAPSGLNWCAEGYQGPLCSACSPGFHDPFSTG